MEVICPRIYRRFSLISSMILCENCTSRDNGHQWMWVWRYVKCLDQPINIEFDHVLELLLSVWQYGRVALLSSRLKFRWVYCLSSNESWFMQRVTIDGQKYSTYLVVHHLKKVPVELEVTFRQMVLNDGCS